MKHLSRRKRAAYWRGSTFTIHRGMEVAAWEKRRNAADAKIDWRFTAEDARIKLKRLYPTISS